MDSSNIVDVQNQIRENSEDLQKYLLDLECWEKEMKRKEEELKLIRITSEEEVPPIRNLLYRSKRKNRHKKQKDKSPATNKKPVSTCDYKAWEKFDADAELQKVDEESKQSDNSASDNSDNEDEFCIQKRKQLALLHKDKGNEFFKNNNYDSAINSYTTGMQLDPENPLLPANRAMAFLKKGQFQAAENDCTLCLSVDPTYVKAYLRRGTARKNLNKFSLATADFSKVLELEPENKQALLELKNLAEKAANEAMDNTNETEVVKEQEIWPQFLGNKVVKHTEDQNNDNVEKSTLPSTENACIFPNSCSVPVMPSTSLIDEDSKVQIDVMEMEDGSFVKFVEDSQNDVKKTISIESSHFDKVESMISEFELLLPPVPTSSYQFLADWNEMANNPIHRYKYLKQFPPEQFPIVFKHYMEPSIFPGLLETLSTSFLENGDDVFDYLKYLSRIGRFSTMVMFLSNREEKDLDKLLESIKKSDKCESEIIDIIKKYKS